MLWGGAAQRALKLEFTRHFLCTRTQQSTHGSVFQPPTVTQSKKDASRLKCGMSWLLPALGGQHRERHHKMSYPPFESQTSCDTNTDATAHTSGSFMCTRWQRLDRNVGISSRGKCVFPSPPNTAPPASMLTQVLY